MLFETKYKVNVPFCKVCNRNVKFSYSLEFFHSCLMNSSFLFFFFFDTFLTSNIINRTLCHRSSYL